MSRSLNCGATTSMDQKIGLRRKFLRRKRCASDNGNLNLIDQNFKGIRF